MSVALKPITRDDLGPLFRLTVAEDQMDFVARNEKTLAQVAYEPNAEAYAIWAGDTRVGLLAWIDFRDYPHLEEHDDPEAGYVWRLVIGADHQAEGYGRAAMACIHQIARDRGLKRMLITAVPKNTVALKLYESIGYARTGQIIDGEVELRLEL
ncbi:acetyltransferase, GNAT family [Candidatus Rhodobacter oscarellae]|uniref:Acetyltransferase, GNAT family n=1 Tax=Candidatus Rhodobacter oscarellae TaxID=1675527 RepID=A0A0J9E835_9RHOB|nr:GNAT family N-acetyltransferase [Candidatus Rhodobacter lobularis]KMW58887.1 acetyltransferase, GNAT family [Candidatus Rhodobacter lobularis]